MIRTPRPVLAIVGIALLPFVAACGGDDGGDAGATTEEATTTTLSEADEIAGMQASLDGLIDVDQTPAEAAANLAGTGNEDLEATFTALTDIITGFTIELNITEPQLQGDTAVASIEILSDGEPFPDLYPTFWERVDGEWKVTRAGACSLVTAAGLTCPEVEAP